MPLCAGPATPREERWGDTVPRPPLRRSARLRGYVRRAGTPGPWRPSRWRRDRPQVTCPECPRPARRGRSGARGIGPGPAGPGTPSASQAEQSAPGPAGARVVLVVPAPARLGPGRPAARTEGCPRPGPRGPVWRVWQQARLGPAAERPRSDAETARPARAGSRRPCTMLMLARL
jgi:hypothetical protein